MKFIIGGLFAGAILFAALTAQAKITTFMAIGDSPYYGEASDKMFEELIQMANKTEMDFIAHVGDVRGGGASECGDKVLKKVAGYFNDFNVPVIYTPGDNEWTDCHKKGSGSKDPYEELDRVREHFFSDNLSLGKSKILMEAQSEQKKFSSFVENRRFIKNDVMFATVHIVGSNNNYKTGRVKGWFEYRKRNNANLAWLDSTLEKAKASHVKALVLFYHANLMNAEQVHRLNDKQKEALEEERAGFKDVLAKIKEVAIKFKKPMLAVQGDFHTFLVDKPFMHETPQGIRWAIENLTRMQVFGAPDIRGTLVKIDTTKKQPFSFEPMPNIPWKYKTKEEKEKEEKEKNDGKN